MTSTRSRAEIRAFVDVLYQPDDIVEVRLIRKSPKETRHKWIAASDLRRLRLSELNDAGFDIYLGACPRTAHGTPGVAAKDCTPERPCGKCNKCVAVCRSLFADFDGITLEEALRIIEEAALPPPTAVVDSGHGIHTYWRLSELLTDLGLFTRYQQAIIAEVHSDPCISDPGRIMRLVGTRNVKGKPVDCKLIEVHPDRVYGLDDFPEPVARSIGTPTPNGPVSKEDRANALLYLGRFKPERADDRNSWIKVGMGLHYCDQSDSMLAEWDRWSMQSDRYEDGACVAQWRSFHADGGITLASLGMWANEDSPAPTALAVSPPRAAMRPTTREPASTEPYTNSQESMAAINRMAETSRQHKSMHLTLAVQVAEWKWRKGADAIAGNIEHPIRYIAGALKISVSHFHRLGQVGRVLGCLPLGDTDLGVSEKAILQLSRLLDDHSDAIPRALETARKLAKVEADENPYKKKPCVRPKHVVAAVNKLIGKPPALTPVRRRLSLDPDTAAAKEFLLYLSKTLDLAAMLHFPSDLDAALKEIRRHPHIKRLGALP